MARRHSGHLYKRGGVWWLRYTINGRRVRQSLDTSKYSEASAKRAEVLTPLAARNRAAATKAMLVCLDEEINGTPAAGRLLLARVWQRVPYDHTPPWRGSRRALSPLQVATNRGRWNRFISWMAEQYPAMPRMGKVSEAMAREYSDWLRKARRLGSHAHNQNIRTLGAVFRLAGIEDHPFRRVQLYSVEHEHREDLTMEEVGTVLAAAPAGEMRRLIMIGIHTGLRLGDVATMRWEQVRGDRVIRRMAKTRKVVAFPVSEGLAAELNQTPVELRTGYVLPDLGAMYEKDHTALSKRIRLLFQGAGIETRETAADGRRRMISRRGFHSLRHTFATCCARENVPEGAVRDWLGHSSVMVTRIYEHWRMTDGQQSILNALRKMPA